MEIQLTIKQIKTFLELLSKDRSSAEFETKLGLSRKDIEQVKSQLGVFTSEEASEVLLEYDINSKQHQEELKVKQEAEAAIRKEQEAKLNQYKKSKPELSELPDGVFKGGGKRSLAEMKRALSELEQQIDLQDLPELSDVEMFQRDLGHGKQFVADKYGFSYKEIDGLIAKYGE